MHQKWLTRWKKLYYVCYVTNLLLCHNFKHKNTQFLVIEMDKEELKCKSSPSSLETAERTVATC